MNKVNALFYFFESIIKTLLLSLFGSAVSGARKSSWRIDLVGMWIWSL
ncbi:hypothetical protein KKG72_03545 [bacterium]|nr:hypothetical protein [bacterium]MBU1993767.1 hypothetical protein [bacterium]